MIKLLIIDLIALALFVFLLKLQSSKTAFRGYVTLLIVMTIAVGTRIVGMVPGILLTAVVAFAICYLDDAGFLA